MKKVELLAPAGNYESLIGAINAGADAVYLGGERFGARAYAENFTEEEICKGIRYAHLFGRKIFLTVNTLIKEREFSTLLPYMAPFYEAGLDGVIVQDMGAFHFLKKNFPKLQLHVSTQMTITGSYGARLMKAEGAVRIVPARELSLAEIRQIKQDVDIELETFIHGAICYCYSGQCLFSSMLGGRSGNRGRCAQPCRLPYSLDSVTGHDAFVKTVKAGKNRKDEREQYPLSMKDLCTIEDIPKLIQAGIDSFKIEGRMKRPEYAAGVTAIYRKYIDLYYANQGIEYHVTTKDKEYLSRLYLRTETGSGYYFRQNGKEMLTLDSPSYEKCEEALLTKIRERYLTQEKKLQVTGEIWLKTTQEAVLSLTCKKSITVAVTGGTVEQAQKQPLLVETVRKQLAKLGNTHFILENLEIHMDENCYMNIRELNELRRRAVVELEDQIISDHHLPEWAFTEQTADPAGFSQPNNSSAIMPESIEEDTKMGNRHEIHLLISSLEQLKAVKNSSFSRIYVDIDLICEKKQEVVKLLQACGATEKAYLVLPYLLRLSDARFLAEYNDLLQSTLWQGVMFRNLEEYEFLRSISYGKKMVSAPGLYVWNKENHLFWRKHGVSSYLPFELNLHECHDLCDGQEKLSAVLYGRIPMMVTANCISKTLAGCTHEKDGSKIVTMIDRMKNSFPVLCNCKHCYNVIYNSVPLSLHQYLSKMEDVADFLLAFTSETKEETAEVLSYFDGLVHATTPKQLVPPAYAYTTGQIKRIVE